MLAVIQNNIVVNTIVASLSDALTAGYTYDDITAVNPQPGIGWTYVSNGIYTAPTPAAALPLNVQYSPTAYGEYLISLFIAGNSARGLTSAQTFQLASQLVPYFILLQTGSLSTFLACLPNIPVDGVLITTAIITEFTEAVEAYLAGD